MFTRYDTSVVTSTPRVLTTNEKKALTDDFLLGKTITDIKHERFIPRNLIEQSFKKKKAIEQYVIQLMREQVIITPTVYEEDGVTIKEEAIYNTKPTSITNLKAQAYVNFNSCTKTAFDYNITKIVESATSGGTWTLFTKLF